MNKIKCMAFGSHPDDVELFCSGLLIKLKKQGFTTGVVDLTRGELSSNGTVESRVAESDQACRILELDIRKNLGLRDGNIENNLDNRLEVIKIIREFQPEIVLLPYWYDRHPDHVSASKLISDSCFYSGLKKIETSHEIFRPNAILYYMLHSSFNPSFVVDITNEMDTKINAIKAYKTQFKNVNMNGVNTYINRPEFLESLKNRAGFYGNEIKTKFGEPYFCKSMLKINNIVEVFT